MAATASSRNKAAPAQLRILNGRGTRQDGRPTDSGGRPVDPPPPFVRCAPEKPAGMSRDASKLWDLVVEQMTTIGLLKPLDGPALMVACETFGRWREAVRMRRKNGLLSDNSQGRVTAPWIGIEERASKEFRAWASEFGFTPAAEQALSGEVSGGPASRSDGNPF